MKKFTVLFFLLTLLCGAGYAQYGSTESQTDSSSAPRSEEYRETETGIPFGREIRLGVRIAPALAINSALGEGASENLSNGSPVVRMGGGITADVFFAPNYAFSTGLYYTVKSSAFENLPLGDPNTGTYGGFSRYNLQFLQVPFSLKLFTNTIAPATRLYFQGGGTFDIKLAEKALDRANNQLYQTAQEAGKKVYMPLDIGILLEAGVETKLGESTSVFAGISYNRGLINALTGGIKDNTGTRLNQHVRSVNTVVALVAGIHF